MISVKRSADTLTTVNAIPRGAVALSITKREITFPMKRSFAPPINSGITNSPKDGMNTRYMPDRIAFMLTGIRIRLIVCLLLAPKSSDASRRELSNLSSDEKMGRTMNGK